METMQGYTRRLWQSQDGLPDQTVQAFAQTNDGSLWIGTKEGLLRFDGDRFRTYDREIAPALLERGINCLMAGNDGGLWIGTEAGGLFRYQNGAFQSYAVAPNQSTSLLVVRSLYQDRQGTIWVGSDQGLFRVSGSMLIRVDGRNGVPTIFVRAITAGPQGNLWVGGTTLLEFHGLSFAREYPLPPNSSLNLVTAMTVTRQGTFWIGMMSGLYGFTDGSFSRELAISAQVSVLQQSTDNRLWVGTVGQGLFLYSGKGLPHIASTILPSQTVGAVFEDREANIWLGTRAGLLRLSKTPVRIIAAPGGADSEFETIFRDMDGTIWVAAQTHLFRVTNGVAKTYAFPELPHVRIRTLFRDRQGGLWIGTDGSGLFHLWKKHVARFSSGHGLVNDFVRAILQSRDGSLWVGTDGGLTHIDSSGSQNFDIHHGLAYFSVTVLFEDHTGDLWVGTSHGLSHISYGRIIQDLPTVVLRQEQMWSINQDASGEIWFGASSGLYGWKANKLVHLSTANGLATNTVYSILRDFKGSVWLSGPNSISRVASQSLDDFTDGQSERVHLDEYLSAFDIESAELYSGMQPSGVITPSGEVWFPSNRGALRVDNSQPTRATPLQIVIDDVIANGRRLPVSNKIVLSPEEMRLEISYLAIRMRSQEGLRYRYRMEGLEPWIDADDRRTVNYTQLPAGRYVFRVQGFAVDNPESVSETSIVIIKEPHFYTTIWFISCCVFGALGMVFLMYQLKLRQMKIRFHAVSEERARLAREMHDTVIQGCVGVSTLLEAALEVEASEDLLRHQLLSYANEQVRTTIEEAREAVWDLRNHAELTTDAGSLCEELAREFQSDYEIPIQCHISGMRFELGESATHELMMMLREALSNAHAHGNPGEINLYVRFSEDHLKIEVHDDGCGFDPEKAMSIEKHYGLVGIQERAKLLGGQVIIKSSRGRGAEIQISLPRRSRAVER